MAYLSTELLFGLFHDNCSGTYDITSDERKTQNDEEEEMWTEKVVAYYIRTPRISLEGVTCTTHDLKTTFWQESTKISVKIIVNASLTRTEYPVNINLER
jgi:hypothetical protein